MELLPLLKAGINAKAMGGNQITGDVNVVYVMPGAASTKQQSASKVFSRFQELLHW